MSEAITAVSISKYSVRRLSLRVVIDLIMTGECFGVFVSSILAMHIYVHNFLGAPEPFERYFFHALAASFLFGYIANQRKLFAPGALTSPQRELLRVVSVLGISLLTLVFVGYLFKFAHAFSRGWMLTWFALGALQLIIGRVMIAQLFAWLIRRGYLGHRVAVVGTPESAAALMDGLAISKPGTQLAGIFNISDEASNYPSTDELVRLGQLNAFDEIYVIAPQSATETVKHALRRLRVLPLPVKVCPSGLNFDTPIRDCQSLGEFTAFSVQGKPITEWGSVLKSVEDYVVATLALLLFAPLFALVAIAIKLDSRGPVFFRQRRHGFNHQVINVWKFRTMTVTDDGDTIVQAKRNDVRVTTVGRILRRTSIDELPQLINVLRGEMSLVGPRPHAIAHNRFYSELFETYGTRHRVKPGITGWAQVNGYRGPTEDPELMRQRVAYDQYYIENWSLLFDFRILLLTPIYGFVGHNAV